MKVASTKASSQSRIASWSSSDRKARHISSRTPVSYQSLRRRRQVEGWGYWSGRSFHLAPVLRIQRIPSKQARPSAGGRPPLGLRTPIGNELSDLFPLLIRQHRFSYTHRITSGKCHSQYLLEEQGRISIAITRGYAEVPVLQPLLGSVNTFHSPCLSNWT
jgi:hypothetical protein